MGSYDAKARGKKKRKQAELTICQRGELLFEDDFSGRELQWTFNAMLVDWKVARKALVLTSPATGGSMGVTRVFPREVRDLVYEARIFMPPECAVRFGSVGTSPFPIARVDTRTKIFSVSWWSQAEGWKHLAQHPFPYRKPRWFHILCEKLGIQYAFTVDGKTITCDSPLPGDAKRARPKLIINVEKKTSDLFAVDDVKVWEALPKDEDNQEGKKKKKKRR